MELFAPKALGMRGKGRLPHTLPGHEHFIRPTKVYRRWSEPCDPRVPVVMLVPLKEGRDESLGSLQCT